MTETYNSNLHEEKSKRNSSSVSIESSTSSSPARSKSKTIENVLILQGGGSLGAFGCGVFKALAKRDIKIDIIAGTSIGGVNARIIAGSKNEEHPEKLLEEFWLELSDSFVDLKKHDFSYFGVPHLMAESLSRFYYSYPAFGGKEEEQENPSTKSNKEIRLEQLRSFTSSVIFGNDKMFKPR